MMNKARLHLIPNILAEGSLHTIPTYLVDIINSIDIFYVEEIRSARRFLKMLNREINIDALTFYMINEHEDNDLQHAPTLFKDGKTIGLISEAGCPNVADPGQRLVAIAHEFDVQVIPHVGPNSILLALMASGFNGQQFQFSGYLPNKQPALSQRILELERESKLKNLTQIFIEVPYRNDQLIQEILKHGQAHSKLCVACDLTGKNELIISKTISEWRKMTVTFHKKPAVFVFYAGEII